MIAGLPVDVEDVIAWGVVAWRALPPETQHELIAEIRHLAGHAAAELAARVVFFDGPCTGDPATDRVRERAALEHLQIAAERIVESRHTAPTSTDEARKIT